MERPIIKAGFSLIELLVVITIIGFLAAIAIPSYIGMQNKAKMAALEKAAQSAMTELQFWMHSANSNDRSLRLVDTNFNLTADGSDLTNEGLYQAGVANTWTAGKNLTDRSPWFDAPLWSTDPAMPNGKITLLTLTGSTMKIVGKDKEGDIIFEGLVEAD